MTVYLNLVVLLNFVVDALLLMGANRLSGYPCTWRRCTLAAVVGGAYGGLCLLPAFSFLGGPLWRLTILVMLSVIAYGWGISALRRGAIFMLLTMALEGMTMGLDNGKLVSVLLAGAGVALLCAVGIPSPIGLQKYHLVELCLRGKTIKLTALMDTGNRLRDPITGDSVMVVGMDVGNSLGISGELIRDPVTMLTRECLPGARLIPYKAVGQPGGMLLMLRFDQVKMNGRVISPMVAFSPEKIGGTEGYQALAGGSI